MVMLNESMILEVYGGDDFPIYSMLYHRFYIRIDVESSYCLFILFSLINASEKVSPSFCQRQKCEFVFPFLAMAIEY